MCTVYVFKTSVETDEQVQRVGASLKTITEISKWNFDLQDCDHILRIEAKQLDTARIGNAVGLLGFHCEQLSD